jgi:nicotinamidase-related amidase
MIINKSERTASALLVIDVQVGVVQDAYLRDEKVANIATTVAKARAQSIPVIWVRHSEDELPMGSDNWQIVPELAPHDGEPIVEKLFRSSFVQTDLADHLSRLNVGHLFICGAETNNCVRHTSHAALEQGFDITLIADAHTTTGFEWNGFEVDAARTIDEQNTNFMSYSLPHSTAKAVKVAELFN